MAARKSLVFVTGNENKLKEASETVCFNKVKCVDDFIC